MGGQAQLVPDQRRLAGQPRHLSRAGAHGGGGGGAAQRPLEHDRRLRAGRAAAHLRRARAGRGAVDRTLPRPRGARPRARRHAGSRGRAGGLSHILRRGRRRGRAGRGRPLPRRAACGRRGLGRAPRLPRGPSDSRARARRRPGDLEHAQDRRQPHPIRDAAPRPRRPARRGGDRPLRDARGVDQSQLAARRIARRRASARRGSRRGAAHPHAPGAGRHPRRDS